MIAERDERYRKAAIASTPSTRDKAKRDGNPKPPLQENNRRNPREDYLADLRLPGV